MSQASQGINSDASGSAPLKRKRGRPRKYPAADDLSPHFGVSAHALREQNLNRRPNIHAATGFKVVNGSQPHQVDTTSSSNDIGIGQLVSGVIEAAFDGGYLLAVRVGDSESTLRGVVFKPGRYVPISAENDVAPNIQMIRRNEIPLHGGNYNQMQVSSSRSRERNGTAHLVASPPNSSVLRGRPVPLGSAQPTIPTSLRGNVVPVVLQPIGASANGLSLSNQPSAAAIQDAPIALPDGVAREAEGKSTRAPGMPFENLVTEVIKRIQDPSQAEGGQNESSKSADKSGSTPEDDDSDDDQPLFIEPLQTVQPNLNHHPNAMPQPLEGARTGKMTELLQENAVKTEMPQDRAFKSN